MTEPGESQDRRVAAAAAPSARATKADDAVLHGQAGETVPLGERVKNILFKPSAEWIRIDKEPASIGALYMRYVVPLAAIPPVATLIGTLAFGYPGFGGVFRPTLLSAVISAVVQYGLTLAVVFVLAFVINALAPRFDASPNRLQAFKVAAYSATAAWVVGIFNLLPALSILSVLGLYSIYLLYLGLPRLMRAPEDKALPYTAVVVAVMLVAGLVIGAISAPLAGQFGATSAAGGGLASAMEEAGRAEAPGVLNLPSGGAVDLGAMASQGEGGAQGQPGAAATPAAPLDAAFLAALLPDTVEDLAMTKSEKGSAGAGIGSNALAVYGSGDRSIELEITDLAALGSMAMAGRMGMERESETATGYERVGTVEGRMTIEKWDGPSEFGIYSVVVGDRAMVRGEGRGVEIDQLKSAVHSIDFSAIEEAANAD